MILKLKSVTRVRDSLVVDHMVNQIKSILMVSLENKMIKTVEIN